MFDYSVSFDFEDGQTTTRTLKASDDWSVCLMALGVQAMIDASDFNVDWSAVRSVALEA
ncbi:hypothetical protein [Pannonibacter carbonis]|uniref:hypothetical protein n=1 Tax=Pannonibacter carbonis TaxID=2067569 RepID=UPI0013003206|nr:hypothetical protein [Pannonibacter carbonis]